MTVTSIATFAAPASSTGTASACVSPLAPTSSYPTEAGAVVYVYTDSDGSLSSECTGCGEYAWTLELTEIFAWHHAWTCRKKPHSSAA
ncbi:hypothetical protein [Streptomyces sp. rh34]|uniref:hypothetical protein n=1 Tax=Streptomyces sp. rh34 TaxID=2034272 RepID=UPI000BF0F75B|nr:hypothetical protein [Streptomyces sp. rh34]